MTQEIINICCSPINEGIRTTGINEGYLGETWISDDYEYICVKAGVAGVAIWKKSLLVKTQ